MTRFWSAGVVTYSPKHLASARLRRVSGTGPAGLERRAAHAGRGLVPSGARVPTPRGRGTGVLIAAWTLAFVVAQLLGACSRPADDGGTDRKVDPTCEAEPDMARCERGE